MEPVTHVLTGACLARTGLNRKAAYTSLAMAIAAEFPDIDTLWSLRGPVNGFEHHRGITHTLLGIPFEAALLVAAVYGLHRWRVARRQRSSASLSGRPLTAVPVRWWLLYSFTLLALLSHLLLDYTNNYGLRPFFPFNPRWYAASITFIFDPLMFAMLLAALVLPRLFGLIGSEVSSGTRRSPFAARGWSSTALLGVLALWTLRTVEHGHAIDLALQQSSVAPGSEPAEYLPAERALASPDPLSPFRWWTATDFGTFYQLGQADTRNESIVAAESIEPKLNRSPAWLAAERSRLGRDYLDWSPMPFVDISTDNSGAVNAAGEPLPANHTLVTFRDPRFMGELPVFRSAARNALVGTVELDGENRVVQQTMGGKYQR